MKYFLRYSFIVLTAVAVYTAGCEKGPQFKDYIYPEPSVAGMTPAQGKTGINVIITGTNFDTLPPAVRVFFGGIKADTVRSANNNQIVVKVPPTAVSGKVTLQVWNHKIDSIGTFTILP
jgi:hypothetical protein